MKTRLLKKLRRIGRKGIVLRSLTHSYGKITGWNVSRTRNDALDADDIKYIFYRLILNQIYRENYSFKKAEELLKEAAARKYVINNIEKIREKYGRKKHGRRNKNN